MNKNTYQDLIRNYIANGVGNDETERCLKLCLDSNDKLTRKEFVNVLMILGKYNFANNDMEDFRYCGKVIMICLIEDNEKLFKMEWDEIIMTKDLIAYLDDVLIYNEYYHKKQLAFIIIRHSVAALFVFLFSVKIMHASTDLALISSLIYIGISLLKESILKRRNDTLIQVNADKKSSKSLKTYIRQYVKS